MIKLFSLKQQKKEEEASGAAASGKKASAAQLRITKGQRLVSQVLYALCLRWKTRLFFSQISMN